MERIGQKEMRTAVKISEKNNILGRRGRGGSEKSGVIAEGGKPPVKGRKIWSLKWGKFEQGGCVRVYVCACV